jgi:hypothetical protein
MGRYATSRGVPAEYPANLAIQVIRESHLRAFFAVARMKYGICRRSMYFSTRKTGEGGECKEISIARFAYTLVVGKVPVLCWSQSVVE